MKCAERVRGIQLNMNTNQLICVKLHTSPKNKLETFWFTNEKTANSFIDSLMMSENVQDYRAFVVYADEAKEYSGNMKAPPLRLVCELDKKDFKAEVTRRETADGLMCEVFLSHPSLGRKRVLYCHKKTLEKMGLDNEEDIVGFIYSGLDFYIQLFMDEGETIAPPLYLLIEEGDGYELKWPPMSEWD